MIHKILLLAFAIAGASIGARVGNVLDTVFTGLETITIVGMFFGAWLGATIGGGELANCFRKIQRGALSWKQAIALVALCATTTAVAVPTLTDSSTMLSGIILGFVFALYQFSRADDYRYAFAALLFGTFIGTVISAADGVGQIAKVIQYAQENGISQAIEGANRGWFHHGYLGRDQEDMLIASAFIGAVVGVAVCLMASFLALLMSSFWRGFKDRPSDAVSEGKPKQKRQ